MQAGIIKHDKTGNVEPQARYCSPLGRLPDAEGSNPSGAVRSIELTQWRCEVYHVSKVPGITKLEPRVPPGAQPGECEPAGARVCAAPTIDQCVLALVDLENNTDYFVYRIEAEPDVDNEAVINWPGAPEEWKRWGDAKYTGEVWYLQPVECTLFATMDCWGEVTEV